MLEYVGGSESPASSFSSRGKVNKLDKRPAQSGESPRGVLVLDFDSRYISHRMDSKKSIRRLENDLIARLKKTIKFGIPNSDRSVKLTVVRLDMRLFDVNLNLVSGNAVNPTEEYLKHSNVFVSLINSQKMTWIKSTFVDRPVLMMPLYSDDSCEDDIMSINERSELIDFPTISGKDILIRKKEPLYEGKTKLNSEDLADVIGNMSGSSDIVRYYLLPIEFDFSFKSCFEFRKGLFRYMNVKNLFCNLFYWACMIQWTYLFLFEWGRAHLVSAYVGGSKGKIWRYQPFVVSVSRLVDGKVRNSNYSWYNAWWYFDVLKYGSSYEPTDSPFRRLVKFVSRMPTGVTTYLLYLPLFFALYYVTSSSLYNSFDSTFSSVLSRTYDKMGRLASEFPGFASLNSKFAELNLKYLLLLIQTFLGGFGFVGAAILVPCVQITLAGKYFIFYVKRSAENSIENESSSSSSSSENGEETSRIENSKKKRCKKERSTLATIVFVSSMVLISFTAIYVVVLGKIWQLSSYLYGKTISKFNKR